MGIELTDERDSIDTLILYCLGQSPQECGLKKKSNEREKRERRVGPAGDYGQVNVS